MIHTVIADATSLITAIKNGSLSLLPTHCERIILTPAVVETLIAGKWIDALMSGEMESLVEVVSLTQEDEALARSLAVAMASLDGAAHSGAAESLALMRRSDLEATLFLSEDPAALKVAGTHGLAARRLAALLSSEPTEESHGSPTESSSAPLRRDPPRTIEVSEETAALLDALLAQGVGQSADEVVRRALRGLAAALA